MLLYYSRASLYYSRVSLYYKFLYYKICVAKFLFLRSPRLKGLISEGSPRSLRGPLTSALGMRPVASEQFLHGHQFEVNLRHVTVVFVDFPCCILPYVSFSPGSPPFFCYICMSCVSFFQWRFRFFCGNPHRRPEGRASQF